MACECCAAYGSITVKHGSIAVQQHQDHTHGAFTVRCLSGTKSCHVTAEAVRMAFEFFSQRAALGFAIPEWLPTPNNLEYHAAVSQLNSAVYGIIEDRKQRLSALQASSQYSQVGNSSCNGLHLDLSALHYM